MRLGLSARSCVAVGHCGLCSGHALAQGCASMGHQCQQPLQRVGCLGQAVYQPGLVAAACGPSCALPATSPSVQRLDCFRHGGIFCACGTVRCPKTCASKLLTAPPYGPYSAPERATAPAQHFGDAAPLPAAPPLWGPLGSGAKLLSPAYQARTRGNSEC